MMPHTVDFFSRNFSTSEHINLVFNFLSKLGLLGNFTDSVKQSIFLGVFLCIAVPPKGINYFNKENVKK